MITQRSAGASTPRAARSRSLARTSPEAAASRSFAQTLSRGIRVVELLAANGAPMTIGEITTSLLLNRSVVYRLIHTLAEHNLVAMEPGGRYSLGLGLLTLARGAGKDLRQAAYSVITPLADQVRATIFLGGADRDELVCVASAEPENTLLRVTHREGLRHPITQGAGGRAILAAHPARPGEGPDVATARRHGFARSREEVEADVVAIAVPVLFPGQLCGWSLVALWPAGDTLDEAGVVARLRGAADQIVASSRQGQVRLSP